jgi:hypothetical protein
MLIERGVDVNACTRSKNTALHLLLRNLSQDITNIDPTTQPMAYLYRPMEEWERASIQLKRATIESYVSLLIRSGASPNVRNNVKLSYRPAALLLTPCLWLCLSLSLSSRFFKPLCRWRSPSKPFLWFICYWMRAIASKSVFEDSSSPLLSSPLLSPPLLSHPSPADRPRFVDPNEHPSRSSREDGECPSPLSAHLSSLGSSLQYYYIHRRNWLRFQYGARDGKFNSGDAKSRVIACSDLCRFVGEYL